MLLGFDSFALIMEKIQQVQPLRWACLACQRILTVAACLAIWAWPAAAQERFQPADTTVVLRSSIHAQSTQAGSLPALDKAWRAQANDLEAALAYARAVFILGLDEGDLRWFGSAKAALTPWWHASDLPAEGFFLRGLVKQGFHDFGAGLQDIDKAIALEPNHPEFWSWRFALHLLLGDLRAARQDCDDMARLFGATQASVYRAVLLYRSGHAQAAIESLKTLIDAANFQDSASQDWLGFHLGEAYRVAGQTEQAVNVWEKRLKANGQSHFLQLSLAEVFNQQGKYRQARETAGKEPYSDALLMQALLASRGLQDGDEKRLAGIFEARIKSQALRKESLIERPQLLYLIEYGKDLQAGLDLSIANWELQKEPPDAVLFVQAALALKQNNAAAPVVDWAAQTGYTDPQLTPLIRQLKAHPNWSGGRP
jgi:tetratricopeptide (TPR) repeat protein